MAELPGALKQGTMVDSGGGPGLQIIDRLERRRPVNFPAQMHPPDDTEDLCIHEVGGRVVTVRGQERAHSVGIGPREDDLSDARGVNDQHRAARPAPR